MLLLNPSQPILNGLSCHGIAAAALRGFAVIKQKGETRPQLFSSSPEMQTSAPLLQKA